MVGGVAPLVFLVVCSIAVAQSRDDTGVPGLLKSRSGMCLSQHRVQVQSGVVHLWDCDERNKNSVWHLDAYQQQIRSSHGGCLGFSSDAPSRVRTSDCTVSEGPRKWHYESSTGRIKDSEGSCLTTVESQLEKVQMKPCQSATTEHAIEQQWDFVATGNDMLGEAMVSKAVDCEVTEWSQFSECTKECGSGVQKRTRAIAKASINGGMRCGVLVENRKCATQPCTALRSCEVGPWSKFDICTHKCGGGVQVRTRDVLVQAQPGGMYCPSLLEERPCNTFGCASNIGKENERITIIRSRAGKQKQDLTNSLAKVTTKNVADVLASAQAYARALGSNVIDKGDHEGEKSREETSLMEAPEVTEIIDDESSPYYVSSTGTKPRSQLKLGSAADETQTLDGARIYADALHGKRKQA